MKKLSTLFICLLGSMFAANAQKPINWTEKELMEPAALAAILKANSQLPLIVSVGPGALIPNSVDIGPASDAANIQAFNKLLAAKHKEEKIVVYCGCCPFAQCPNVRPAIQALKDGGFTNYYLLNIPKNLKTDWIDKGYPTTK